MHRAAQLYGESFPRSSDRPADRSGRFRSDRRAGHLIERWPGPGEIRPMDEGPRAWR